MDFSILQFCQKCYILSFSERPLYFFAFSILSVSERTMDFSILQFCQKCSILSFCERGKCIFFFTFSILSKMVLFVIFEKWTSNYEISISILCVHYVLWYIKLVLSKMPYFVILWEARVFFRFFNFVKNAQFCHFVRGPWIFSLLQFCQKWSILSFCERGKCIFFFTFSILS